MAGWIGGGAVGAAVGGGGVSAGAGGHGAMSWPGHWSVSTLRMRPDSDWSIVRLHRALIAVQSARYVHTAAGSGGSQFDGSLSPLSLLTAPVTARNERGSSRSLP